MITLAWFFNSSHVTLLAYIFGCRIIWTPTTFLPLPKSEQPVLTADTSAFLSWYVPTPHITLTINRDGPPWMLLLDVALLSSSVDGQLSTSLILEHTIQNHQSHENAQLPLFAISIVLAL